MIILSKNNIVTVQAQTKNCWIGFDCFTESLVSVSKKESMELPLPVIKQILSCEKERLLLAMLISDHNYGHTAKTLGLTRRAIFRMRVRHKLKVVKQKTNGKNRRLSA